MRRDLLIINIRSLLRAASYLAILAAGFFAGHVFFSSPSAAPSSDYSTDQAALVDSLIAGWAEDGHEGIWEAAGMTKVKPSIEGARFGYFPPRVVALAQSIDSLFHIPDEVVLAQFALESRFGLSDLGANNFFGHKYAVALKYSPHPPQYVQGLTREFIDGEWRMVRAKFARYKTVEDCFHTHGMYLSSSPVFAGAGAYWSDPVRYSQEIGKHYASDPNYALKLITIMKRYQLLPKPSEQK